MRFVALLSLALLSACATMVEGTTDTVTLSSTPEGATCTLERGGERIGAVASTPGSVSLSKSRNDLVVQCSKPGYRPETKVVQSSFTGTTFGNLLLGGVVGVVVDAASGANSQYPKDIRIDMAEEPRPAAAPMAGQYPLGIMPVSYHPATMAGS